MTPGRGLAAALVLVASLPACGGRKKPPPRAGTDAPAAATAPPPTPTAVPDVDRDEACAQLPFAESIAVPEASGSALLPVDGADALLVVSDSGNRGAYVIVDPGDGRERETGQLPISKQRGDDVEGLAVRGGLVVGLTSSGWVTSWKRAGAGFATVDGPYALADLDSGLACDPTEVNCGKNYEALCLAPGPAREGECVGLAGSKTDGHLYCLTEVGGRLVASSRAIPVSAPETLTGCDVAPDGSVWAGTNLFGRSTVYRITGWATPEQATVVELGSLGPGFPESIAVGPGGVVYRFSDLGGAPSMVAKYRCADPGGRISGCSARTAAATRA